MPTLPPKKIRALIALVRRLRISTNPTTPTAASTDAPIFTIPTVAASSVTIIPITGDHTPEASLPSITVTSISHEFAAFMVHMPAFNALLEGLQRRQPAAPSLLCQLILSSWNSRHPNSPLDPHQLSIQSVIAEISLICPVFRTRMQVPGRIVGCQHVDMFDMEAYLHREAVWPRLACPICGNKSPAGINGLSIDASLIHTMALAPKSATSIQVRSDGFWRLTPPLAWQLPASIDQWQPIVGPHTYAFSLALQVGAVCVTDPPLGPQQQPQQQQQQQKSFAGRPTKRIFDDAALSESKLLTGADGEAVTPAKKFVSHASPVPPAFSSALPPSSVGSQTGIVSPSVVNGPSSVLSQTEGTPTKEKWNAETTPQQNSPIPPGLNCAPEQRRVSSAGCTPVTRPVAGQSFQQQQQFVVPSYDSEYAVAPCRTSVTRRNSASTPAPEAGTMGYSPSPSKSATGLGGPELSTAPPSQKSSTDYLSPCGTPQTGCIVSSSISIACTPTVSQYAVNNLYFSTPAPSMRDTSESGTASPFAKPPPPPPPQLLSNTTSRGVASIDSTDSFRPPPPRICHSEMSNASEIISLSESSCNQVSDSPKFSTSGSLTNGSSDKAFHFSDGHEPPRSSGDASRDSSGNTDLQKSAGEEFKTCRSAPTLTAAPSHIELHFLINTLPESLLECALERTQSLDSFLQTDYLNYVMGL
ncbi:unnamed protein product [Schistocephalus solidus]|uniref:SP-RING-type domain-containing protein n=1 Tax=Schistocephalus solidus TaxID=70667 RepID=A0A183SJB5_SCHSO|nr:unnamed protein product [Schistocephalus solidus]